MKILRKILVIVVIVVFGLGLLKDQLVRIIINTSAESIVGAPVHIDGLSFGLFKQSIRIKGIKMYNPPGFPREILLDIPEVGADYDLGALMKGELHLPLAIVNLKEMVLIRNKDGKLNVDSLKVVQKSEPAKETKPSEKPSKPMAIRIDVAKLNLGQVIVKDYTQGDPPFIQAYDIGIHDKTYKNINSAEQFITLLLIEAMKPAAIKGAAVYGTAAILGAAVLPVGVASVFLGKDSGVQELPADFNTVFKTAVDIMGKSGSIERQDPQNGVIKGKLEGADVTIELTKKGSRTTTIKVSARKMMLPKPEIAQGILYQISQKFK